jgi:outer membrane receptor protein involved in Fe transport
MYKTQRLVLIILITFSYNVLVKSQKSDRQSKMPEGNGTITGIVIDKDNSQSIEGATITIFKSKDSTKVGGAETDKKGMFSLSVPYGRYIIEVNMVGFGIAAVSGILVSPKKSDIILDTIKITQGEPTTEDIDVTAEKSIIQFTPEKKIFNVSETPLTSNGTATDVLKNVPSVSVDNDGNISLRGNQNVRILLDGKPLYDNASIVLESIPSSSVESVELITNPSAKYEAEGETGFINVVLKKNEDFGYNGQVMLSFGNKDKYNASATVSVKNKKFNIYGNYSFQSLRFGISQTSDRYNTLTSTSYLLDQPGIGNFRNLSNLGKVGIDYQIAKKQTLSFSTTLSLRKRDRDQNITNNIYDIANVLNSQSISHNYNTEKGYNYDAALDYVAKFKNPKQQLSMEATYSRVYEDEPTTLINQYYVINYNPITAPNGQQFNEQLQHQNVVNYQADYSQPLSKDSKLDIGLKSTYRYRDQNFSSEHLDSISNVWISDIGLNNDFKYREFINGLYANYSNKFGEIEFQLGLRSEYTYTRGELVNDPTQNFTKRYIDFFPSASISDKIGKSNEFLLSYARRLNRPRPGMLNPYIEITDPYDLRKGNPNLNPEYIDAYELSFLKYIKGATITSSIFFRDTHGLISRYRTLIDSVTSLTSPINLSRAYSYGFELIANLQTPRWLNFNGSFSYYKTDIKGGDQAAELTNSGYTWSTKFFATIKMWLGLELSAIYNYQSKRPVVEGFIEPMQSLDVSLKRVFFNKKFDISARVSDIFNTQQFKINTSNTGYTQNFLNKRDSRVAYLTLTYRFGNLNDMQQRREKKRNNDDTNPPENDF